MSAAVGDLVYVCGSIDVTHTHTGFNHSLLSNNLISHHEIQFGRCTAGQMIWHPKSTEDGISAKVNDPAIRPHGILLIHVEKWPSLGQHKTTGSDKLHPEAMLTDQRPWRTNCGTR